MRVPCAEQFSTATPRVSFYPRLAPLLAAEVSVWYASARRNQAALREEEALLGPALRPPSALSMLVLPSDEHVKRGIGVEGISVRARDGERGRGCSPRPHVSLPRAHGLGACRPTRSSTRASFAGAALGAPPCFTSPSTLAAARRVRGAYSRTSPSSSSTTNSEQMWGRAETLDPVIPSAPFPLPFSARRLRSPTLRLNWPASARRPSSRLTPTARPTLRRLRSTQSASPQPCARQRSRSSRCERAHCLSAARRPACDPCPRCCRRSLLRPS